MDFDASLASGPHARLAELVGEWTGTATVWHEPKEPHSVDHMTLVAEPVAGGRAIRITTTVGLGPGQATGELLVGYHLHDAQWQGAWVDSAHTGTQLIMLEGDGSDPEARPSMYGTWPAGEDRWGWQVSLLVDGPELLVAHDIVPPGRDPSRGIEWRCRRG